MTKNAVVLLSGGLDSAVALAIAVNEGYHCSALSFRYGQRHSVELEAAKKISSAFGITDHRTAELDLRLFGGSALTAAVDVPKHQSVDELEDGIPVTYVPARNIIFLSYGLAMAEVTHSRHLFIGVNALDYSGYPDCRPSFIEAYQTMAALGTQTGVEGHPVQIHTPLINLTKADIIKTGSRLGVDFSLTHSCYDPSPEGYACGQCDSCLLRKKGFHEAQISDPTKYIS
jgi:7-cyano-7-deazaguanine synthase